MATKKAPKGTNGYWQGQTDARLDTMASDITEIKDAVKAMNHSIDGLRLWKAKVAGVSAGASTLIVMLVKVAEKWL